ncbi:unnamed protein product [Enterobius vermicularis]|uniref:Nuclear transcription factor Y subunit n=1 Tax=Enterobius vermicularis TaxID=51028 RepID=A0A0N4V073_ENTVE|nr:unnamed protein product [Enterobius vermicularis]
MQFLSAVRQGPLSNLCYDISSFKYSAADAAPSSYERPTLTVNELTVAGQTINAALNNITPVQTKECVSKFDLNPRQIKRILIRRNVRRKLEEDGKVAPRRRGYLHESRHQHALRRVRGMRGQFCRLQAEDSPSL